MSSDLRIELLHLLPSVIAWAESASAQVIAAGSPLSPEALDVARRVGVREPERVRVLRVDAMPKPADPVLRRVAMATGLLGPDSRALTLGYGIQIKHTAESPAVLAHECRHVHQYEIAGSIGAFLALYLAQIVAYGYRDAPLEIDARAYESRV